MKTLAKQKVGLCAGLFLLFMSCVHITNFLKNELDIKAAEYYQADAQLASSEQNSAQIPLKEVSPSTKKYQKSLYYRYWKLIKVKAKIYKV